MKRVGSIAATLLLAMLLAITGACNRSPGYYLQKANTQAAQDNYQAAEVNYRKVIQLDPSDGEAYYQLSSVLLRQRRMQEGYTSLSRASELLRDRDDVTVKLANVTLQAYLADSRRPKPLYDRIGNLADQLLARNADSFEGLRLKGHLTAADRKFPEAEAIYEHANRVKPMNPQVILAWTQVLFQDQQPKRAETLALEFLQKDKSFGPIYDLLYSYYSHEKRQAEAEKVLEDRVAANPTDSEGIVHLAAYDASIARESDMRAMLQKLLDNPKAFPNARTILGDFYVRLRRWDEATAQYQAGAKSDPKEKIGFEKKIVDVLMAQGKAEQANALVDEILKEQPGDEPAQEVKASFLLGSRKPENVDKAVLMFQSLSLKKPEDASRHYNLGRALVAKGDVEGARNQFQEAVQRRRDYIPPRIALIEINQARGDYKASLQYAEQVLALNPGMERVRLAHAVGLMNTGRELEASRELSELERAYPKDNEIQFQTAMLDLRERRYKDAETLFRKLIPDDGGDGRAMGGLAQSLVLENQGTQAIDILQDRLKKAPHSVPLHAVLAKTAAETGKYDLAVGEYQQMLAAAPNSEPTCLALGTVFRMKGDFSQAISWFEKARALAPGDPEPTIRLAGALAVAGRKAEALDKYRHALNMKPDDAASLNNSAYLITEMGGNLDEALTMAKKAVEADAKQANYVDTLGWVYLKKHLDDSAAQVFRGLTERYPDNATFHYHFGMALLARGDRNSASAEFKTALLKQPSEAIRASIVNAMGKTG